MAKYPVTASKTNTPSLTKANRANRPTNKIIIKGLESVTANAVTSYENKEPLFVEIGRMDCTGLLRKV